METTPLTNVPVLTAEETLIKRLRNQAQADACFDNVCKLFANRKRARQEITLQTLKAVTKGAGYNYSHDQHAGVLRFLGSVGVGEIETRDGKLYAIRNVKYNLAALGNAANNNKPAPTYIERFKASYGPSAESTGGQFKAMLTKKVAKTQPMAQTPPPTSQRDQSRFAPLVQTPKPITVSIDAGNGMPMTLTLPHGTDLVAFLAHIYNFSK